MGMGVQLLGWRVAVGEVSTKILESGLTVANANSVPGNRISKAFVQGTAYVAGKIAELHWMEPAKP